METRIMALIVLLLVLWLLLSPSGKAWASRFLAAMKSSGAANEPQ
jgi:hypothetical protein